MNQIDEIVGSFLDPLSPSGRSGGDSSSNAHWKEDVSRVELKANEWNEEDREKMIRICDQVIFLIFPTVCI